MCQGRRFSAIRKTGRKPVKGARLVNETVVRVFWTVKNGQPIEAIEHDHIQRVVVTLAWSSMRSIRKRRTDIELASELGTVSPAQYEDWTPPKDLYMRHWDILKPSAFSGEPITVSREYVNQAIVIFPDRLVKSWVREKAGIKNKKLAIQKAIGLLLEHQVPVCHPTVNALLALYKRRDGTLRLDESREVSREYIRRGLIDAGLERTGDSLKTPMWLPARQAVDDRSYERTHLHRAYAGYINDPEYQKLQAVEGCKNRIQNYHPHPQRCAVHA